MRRLWRAMLIVAASAWIGVLGVPAAFADRVELRDGRALEGSFTTITSLSELPGQNTDKLQLILMCDDDLRRTFVPKRMVGQVAAAGPAEVLEKINIRQIVARGGRKIAAVGPILEITPFDEYGRRIFSMMTDRGRLDVVQGITEITPVWTKVEGLQTAAGVSYVWDMRVATSSIPRDVLSAVIARHLDAKNMEHRLKVVRLYLQSQRYEDARDELTKVIADFPEQSENLKRQVTALRQLAARQILNEVRVRQQAGQDRLAMSILEKFPGDEVSGETLAEVRERLAKYHEALKNGQRFQQLFTEHVKAVSDEALRPQIEPIHKEIMTELTINTFDRMAAYMRLADDPQLSAEEKLSLAISGWLLGPNAAEDQISVALSLVKVRDLVRDYLREPEKLKRDEILVNLASQTAATPELIANLIAHMKPAVETEPQADRPAGFFELAVPSSVDGEPDVQYLVQLPPEYDPYRRYPAVLTLRGAGTTTMQQLEWWAGGLDGNNNRLGQATRHGYITIAVEWPRPQQQRYEYSAREHAAALATLRDASRRFSIDANRVFLSGHSMGADAAWDIALAHPDLWAGVIPIVGLSDKYCSFYTENALQLPMYAVAGEFDGDKPVRNARDLNKYMTRNHYDITLVEYRGRGHENFHEEILRIFDWMGRKQRNFYPREFEVVTMRPWDNFFWWVEFDGMPPKTQVDPFHWPPRRGTRPMTLDARITATNRVRVSSGPGKITVWLSPKLVNFDSRLTLELGGQRVPAPEPSIEVLLEDVRTRGDRQNPFWAKASTEDAGGARSRVARGAR